MTTKCTKWPQNIPFGRKVDKSALKQYEHLLHIARPSKIYPNWDFWFENTPSGNPGAGEAQKCRLYLIIIIPPAL
jgi:hypothetical protein